MKVYSVYFSPTGGTKKVADYICSAWTGERVEIDLSDEKSELEYIDFKHGDILVVTVPCFGGRVPQFIIPKLESMKGKGTRAIIATAYGNRDYEDTLLELKDALKKSGFICIAAAAAIAQHSLAPKIAAGRPNKRDEISLKVFSERCAELSFSDKEVEVPGKRPYREIANVPAKPSVKKGCVDCGRCAKGCPVNAISREDVRKTDKAKCISCMKCVANCPTKARQVNGLILKVAEMGLKKVCKTERENEYFYCE